MKICILRRDGNKVHNGMVFVLSTLTEKYFGKKTLSIEKTEEELTEMITFDLSNYEEYCKIVEFIAEVSKLNSLYAVRILN